MSTLPLPTPPSESVWFTVDENRVRLLRDGQEAIPAILSAIASAEREVLVEMYWFAPDAAGIRVRDELAAAAKRGVVVRVIYDLPGDGPDIVDLKTVRAALAGAFFVSSIARKPREAERLRRAGVSEETGLQDALSRYVENNPDLNRLKDDLLACAARLEQELQEREK